MTTYFHSKENKWVDLDVPDEKKLWEDHVRENLKTTPLDNKGFVAFAIFSKWYFDECGVDDMGEESLEACWNYYHQSTLSCAKNEHFGNCTKAPISCLRCHYDELFDTATLVCDFLERKKKECQS